MERKREGTDYPVLETTAQENHAMRQKKLLIANKFYVDYQPWITLIYLAIFAGPVVGYLFTLI